MSRLLQNAAQHRIDTLRLLNYIIHWEIKWVDTLYAFFGVFCKFLSAVNNTFIWLDSIRLDVPEHQSIDDAIQRLFHGGVPCSTMKGVVNFHGMVNFQNHSMNTRTKFLCVTIAPDMGVDFQWKVLVLWRTQQPSQHRLQLRFLNNRKIHLLLMNYLHLSPDSDFN